ncbi:MAG: hypothetical protein AABZ06_13920 [Bdellovibrionota bacterium]
MKKIILTLCLIIFLSQNTYAGKPRGSYITTTRVTRDAHFVYYRTPWKEMLNSERREAIEASIEALKNTLLTFSHKHEKKINTLVNALKKSHELNGIASDAEELARVAENYGFKLYEAIPSGFMVFVGGKFTAELKIGGGGSGTIAMVVVPVKVQPVRIETGQKVRPHLELDWSLVFIPSVDVGGGIGAGASFRIGAGLVWGRFKRAKDFAGPMLSISKSIECAVGLNVKVGMVRNLKLKQNFTFVMTGISFGPSAEIAIHGNGAFVIPVDNIFTMIGGEPDTFSGTDRVLLKEDKAQELK